MKSDAYYFTVAQAAKTLKLSPQRVLCCWQKDTYRAIRLLAPVAALHGVCI